MKRTSTLIKHIVDIRTHKKNPTVNRIDLRSVNRIVQRILDNNDLTKKIYTSFSAAIDDLFSNGYMDRDSFDEILFKRWLQHDNSFFLLEELVKKNQLTNVQQIKNFVNELNLDDLTDYIVNNNFLFTTTEHLHQELGINFDISIDVFFIRLANDARFFDNEVKLYIKNQSNITEYIVNDLKNNIDFYINKLYVINKYKYL